MAMSRVGGAFLMRRPVAKGVCRFFSSEVERDMVSRFWSWTTQHRPSWRESGTEAAVLFTVFGVTGSTSVACVRPLLKSTLGLEGDLWNGPWSFRVASLVLVSPVYSLILVTIGTLSGRHRFFANMGQKTICRFLPPSWRPKDRFCSQWSLDSKGIFGKTIKKSSPPPSPPR